MTDEQISTPIDVTGAHVPVRQADPSDSNQLLAVNRLGYGPAENQSTNEVWTLEDDTLTQALWNRSTLHDFAHFNNDGTITMWVHAGGSGFAPRTARLLDSDGTEIFATGALYASRFAVADNWVFALTGTGDWYANDDRYVELVADNGAAREVLDVGASYAWIDTPLAGLLVAYPLESDGVTSVWDSRTLEPLLEHPLAGQQFQRIAANQDATTVVAVSTTGALVVLDPMTGEVGEVFGSVDIHNVDQALTLSADGTIAVTIERDGLVTMWWVGNDIPVLRLDADAGQPRWVPEPYAARSASATATNAERLALRIGARPGVSTSWKIIDLESQTWIDIACERAGRALTNDEREALGLSHSQPAC